ncbi:MAG TPA: hypothetical protein VMH04_23120 [Candidatus Solibacter sp.]|nr:hypothetical protein [Candidatus Solibacter sp.]
MNPSPHLPSPHRPPPHLPPHWKQALLLAATVFISCIYFYEGGGWNQNSRFDLVRAIVERHTLQIDAFHENTQDKAYFQGHYYSDKAPGLVFLAVPFFAVARPVLRMAGVDPESPRGEFELSYLVGAGSVALPIALAAMCVFLLCLRFGADVSGAAFATLVMCVGTPLWAYASLFWAHALVGACLVFALAAAMKLAPGQNNFLWALAVGLAAGWATVTEYPAAPASAILAVFAVSRVWKDKDGGARLRAAFGIGVGAAICIAVLLGYLYAAFGSFRPSYSYYDPQSFSFMQQQGYMGLTYPHPDRLLKLLFGCSRGLFFASPVMLVAPVGLWWSWKQKTNRGAMLVIAAIAAYYFLFNASFYWWKAGLSFGPRYAGACIPLLCVGLSVAWSRAKRMWRIVIDMLALASVFVALAVISTNSQLSMQDSCPLFHQSLPAFVAGQLSLNHDSMLTVTEAQSGTYGAFNLGELLGLRGLASLIPLFGLWATAAVCWWRLQRSERAE